MTGAGPRVVVEADGGARGNPGPAGYGAVVRDAGTGQVLAERAEAIGVATNNVAEYRGLLAGLTAAAEVGAAEVEVRMDSKLVVEQMCGRWQIKNPGLRPLAAEAAVLVRRFDAVTFTWIPRERNRHADALANAAMDQAAGRPPKASRPTTAAEPPAALTEPGEPGEQPGRTAPAGGVDPAVPPADGGPLAEPLANGGPLAVPLADGGPLAGPAKPTWEPRPASTATRLVLIRHGETELTAQRRYSGRGDVPLAADGAAQARAVAARVAALAPSVAAVVSSPLSRCTATASIVAEALGGAPVRTADDLIECDFGAWEGRTFAEVRAGWPAELDAWLASPEVAPPGGESFVEVTHRVRRAVADLLRAYPGETVVVVSHVSPLKIALRDALAAGDAFLHRLFLDPTGLSIVDVWADGGIAVRTVNETAHLADL
ncbi:bifunctional RNase H/acid phosphatase [Solwaraspora sp. WMMD1047]|uniref:bifunctional RNase H/acid phosphatase n=1 Tax=Solwaraspora sp. WMMD1047 TaxID=3016102 RepID=UPI002417F5FF|nr:bifunctional RNase H/acid phosphatase [Solwaraspora sp. WMMD1047]MDG4832359.1 bifunctional RNase H/acid phosphatase [Solwaraspora sp. WMMD1047]